MRLQTMIMINRAPFKNIKLNLANENVFVLSGINGTGKTTVLSYIVDAFYELARLGFHNEFEKNPDKYYRFSSDLFSLESNTTSIVYMRFIEKPNDKAYDYIDIRGKCSRDEYDNYITLPEKIPYNTIISELEESNSVKLWSVSEVKKVQTLFSDNILTYFPAYRYETPGYINDPYKMELSFSTQMHFSGYLYNPIEVTSDLQQIANWIMDVVLDREIYHDHHSIQLFEQLNDLITNILISKHGFRTRLGIGTRNAGLSRISIVKRDEEGIRIYPSIFNMSSGELTLLSLFAELVKQTDKIHKIIQVVSGVVLIDEIDKHLHIKLQKEILPKLIKLFPNIQFIVSSHSPFFSLGLQEEPAITYSLIDLEQNGMKCLPIQTDIYKEVYNMLISENERFAAQCEQLQATLSQSIKPLIITEGKTDWKHIKAAKKRLGINDIDFDLYEYEHEMGDTSLYKLLIQNSIIPQPRVIIGIFDRDKLRPMNDIDIIGCEYKSIGNNVYAFAIPLIHENDYGDKISIEHYYNKKDLCKQDEDGRRLFLGSEFLTNGNSINGKYQTSFKGLENKVAVNGIIDEKVYKREDLKQTDSIAKSKSSFAQSILDEDDFSKDFDMSSFHKIFDIIKSILNNAGITN